MALPEQSSLGLIVGVVASVVTSVLTFATLLYNGRQTRLREERNRQWDLEDRKERAKVSAEKTQELHTAIAEVRAKTVLTQAATLTTRQVLGDKIDEGTAASKLAQELANNVNEKFVALGLRMKGRGPKADDKAARDGA